MMIFAFRSGSISSAGDARGTLAAENAGNTAGAAGLDARGETGAEPAGESKLTMGLYFFTIAARFVLL